MNNQPGTLYDTGVGTIGGRGQQATIPYPTPQHTVTIRRVTEDTHNDYHVTADTAIRQRIERFRENAQPYTRDGMALTYTDTTGTTITLTYQEPK